MYVLIFQPF
jgi:hypothetical protein